MNTEEILQDFLNRSVAHVRAQGQPSINEKRKCVYRGLNGLQCAAGIFILEYHPTMDDDVSNATSWSSIASRFDNYRFEENTIKNSKFISTVLQASHDAAAEMTGSFIDNYNDKIQIEVEFWNKRNNMSLKVPE